MARGDRARMFAVALLLATTTTVEAIEEPSGYWKFVDERRGFTTTVFALYVRDGVLYGRNIVDYDESDGSLVDTVNAPVLRARIAGRPYLTQIDFIWGLRRVNDRWVGGHVLDPRTGFSYGCELSLEAGSYVLRGYIGPIGRKITLYPVTDADLPPGFVLPPTDDWIPALPHL